MLRKNVYRQGESSNVDNWRDIEWRNADGTPLNDSSWHDTQVISVLLADTSDSASCADQAVAILVNASSADVEFQLPQSTRSGIWHMAFASSEDPPQQSAELSWQLLSHSIACLHLR